MTKCDYCEKTAHYLIFTCKDHLKALDKNHSRKETHSIDYSVNKKLQTIQKEHEELVQTLQGRIDELTKKLKEKKAEQ